MVAENRLWRAWWRSSRRLLVLIISSQSICIRRRLRVFPNCGRYPHRSAGHLRCDSRPIAAGRRRGLTRRRTGEDGGSIRSAPEHVGCRHSQDRETGLAVHALRVVADVRDRPCLIVDMISTGGTIASSINALLDAPVRAARSSWPPPISSKPTSSNRIKTSHCYGY